MKKEEKTLVINELVEKLNANNKIYLADCSSLSVEKVNAFRKACFAKNVSVSVVKNTLLVLELVCLRRAREDAFFIAFVRTRNRHLANMPSRIATLHSLSDPEQV